MRHAFDGGGSRWLSNEIEAFGALATAGLTASELDTPSAQRARWWRHKEARAVDGHVPGACANCETPLVGEYCHACGQQGHVHRSVGHVFEEFLHGIWHFDSKAWRTLPLLAFRPGKLTWDYTHGKRARYIAPVSLFLLSIFLMFFVFGFVGAPDFGDAFAQGSKIETVADAQGAVADIKGKIQDSTAELAEAKREGDARRIQDSRTEIAAQQVALRVAEAGLRSVARPASGAPVATGPAKSWKEEIADNARSGKLKVHSRIPWVDENVNKALENPDFAFYRIQQKAYKLSFLLVPMSLPVLWLLFCWRRDTTIYDHVVFSLYSLSFMSLLLVIGVLLAKSERALELAGGPSIHLAGLLWLVPPIHMFGQLKGGYRLTTWGALWRVVVLGQASLINLGGFGMLIVVLGLAD